MVTNFLNLSGVHVFITGAAGGVGVATSRAFLEQGAKVTLQYNSSKTTLEPLAAEYPDTTFLVQARVDNEEQAAKAFEESIAALGPIQVLVSNHGIWPKNNTAIKDMDLEQWNNTLNVNLTGSFIVLREYLKQLEKYQVQNNVAVVFVGSIVARLGQTFHADYATSKSALEGGLMNTLKNELVKIAPRGRVNTVAPAYIRTPMAEGILQNKELLERSLTIIPLHKISEPEDVANSVLFLASERASGNITGHVLDVNGGI
ncbi:hypothetical protein LPJ73_001884 [Coemansia sp. RSA 2703]|nr:hypothetical protein LPJ73_001884 [Coemansia sp. RSA 2703]KAJ2372828.1 hypothetical protein IW150_003920 [Coemansia sp. RSA 2607]KAJ2395148.1 hypothetical protein GGI05_001721 [Coemansia sp. RSA 2603]